MLISGLRDWHHLRFANSLNPPTRLVRAGGFFMINWYPCDLLNVTIFR